MIDSCIEVIIGLPNIRSHRMIHRIPSYFDSPDPTYLAPRKTCLISTKKNFGNLQGTTAIERGHDSDTFSYRMFTDDELIKKKDIFDPI